jgi:hypothetical protein
MLDGFKVSEVKVSHHPRIHGVTKYNWKRGVKGIIDMIFLWFWRKYSMRPVHIFGAAGIASFFLGGVLLFWMLVEKVYFGNSIGDRLWPMIGIFMTLAGIQLFITGILADMLMRDYYRGRGRMNYTIKKSESR